MDTQFVEFFVSRWKRYFAGSELPMCYFYADQVRDEDAREGWRQALAWFRRHGAG